MIVAIHQPHYFPWLGYFDKMAKSDVFVLLDCVQFEKGSQMIRNRVLTDKGEIKYITISADTKDFLEREYREIHTKNQEEWKLRQINALKNYYRSAQFFDEGMEMVLEFLKNDYCTLCEWTSSSIELISELLDIKTKIVYQSDIQLSDDAKKSDLVLAICKALQGTCYLSGKGGSVDYLNYDSFEDSGIHICFQDYTPPKYNQLNFGSFVSGLSVIDVIMNCGVKGTKELLWNDI